MHFGTYVVAMMADNIEHVISYWMMWHAMVLLVIHGLAGVLWQTASQLLLHDIVPANELQSAVRLNATARYLGILVGPAVGGLMMLTLTPSHGILLNTVFYLPSLLWLWKAPYGPRFRHGAPPPRRAVRGLADITQTIRDISQQPVIVTMILLAGAASFFIGGSYQAQMPGFAQDLGHGDPGVAYSMLLAADAAGALLAGFILESSGLLRAKPRTALILAIIWCLALAGFAKSTNYPMALTLLFTAGFFELSFSSMTQTLVQMNAPTDIRGRVIGLFNMSALGLRTFSGVTVGLMGTLVGVHNSLAGSALVLLALTVWLLTRTPRPVENLQKA